MATTSTVCRLFRFGLATLFIALTIFGVLFGIWTNRVKRQQRAVAAILAAGGRVTYAQATLIGSRVYRGKARMERGKAHEPNQSRAWFADDWWYSVTGVSLHGDGCNDHTVAYLKDLPEVRSLALWAWATLPPEGDGPLGGRVIRGPFAGVTDEGLKVVSTLPSLESLSTLGNSFTDEGLRHLHHHPKLKRIQITPGDCNATLAGIELLERTLSDAHTDR
jgi:hypothetical protein